MYAARINHQFLEIFYEKLKKLSKKLVIFFFINFFKKSFLKWFKGHTLIKPLKLHIKLQTSTQVQTQEAFKKIYINTFHSSQFRIEAFFNCGNTQKQGCSWCGAILSHFQHRTLRCGLAKIITAPHLIFAVTCLVWCCLEFSQNYNHIALHFYDHMYGAVRFIRCGLKLIYFSNFGFFLPILKLIFPFILGQVLNY